MTVANKAFGDNMLQVDSSPNKFVINSGDVNQDNAVDLTDVLQPVMLRIHLLPVMPLLILQEIIFQILQT